MTAAVDDLQFLQYGAEELKNYLLAKDLFWPVLIRPIKKSRAYPKLTLGNLLLALQRLEALSVGRKLTPEEQTHYIQLKRELEAIQNRWLVAWEGKAAHEYRSRYQQWAQVLNEIYQDREKQAPYYSADVRLRVLLALLENHAPADEKPDIQPLDTTLRAIFDPGVFVWDQELQPGFATEVFWFLYGGIHTD
jgi:hypothetical protein